MLQSPSLPPGACTEPTGFDSMFLFTTAISCASTQSPRQLAESMSPTLTRNLRQKTNLDAMSSEPIASQIRTHDQLQFVGVVSNGAKDVDLHVRQHRFGKDQCSPAHGPKRQRERPAIGGLDVPWSRVRSCDLPA